MSVKNYSGQTFGNLTVVERVGLFEFPDRQNKCGRHTVTSVWKCKCVCGREVEVKTDKLRRSKASCGNPDCPGFIKTNQAFSKPWEPIIDGVITKIPLGNSDKFALIDTEDLDKVKLRSWSLTPKGYVFSKISGKKVLLHRLILEAPKGTEVDHIHHDTLDNRKSEIRLCTKSQNQHNQERIKLSNTDSKGVHYNKRTHKFQAYIGVNKMNHHLGFYDTYNEAMAVRKQAEIDFHKEFRYQQQRS